MSDYLELENLECVTRFAVKIDTDTMTVIEDPSIEEDETEVHSILSMQINGQ